MPTSFTTIVQHLDATALTTPTADTGDPMDRLGGDRQPFFIGVYSINVAMWAADTDTKTPSREWFVALKIRGKAASFEARGPWNDFDDGVDTIIGARSKLAAWGASLAQAANAVQAATA